MEKLLHERLRGHNGYVKFKCCGESVLLWKREAEAVADEIEKYYIPRPRFEDGEPVQWGDETEYGTIRGFTFNGPQIPMYAGTVGLITVENDTVNIPDGELIKRLAPKLLDADGVPCKGGDKGWCRNNGAPCEIVNVSDNGVLDIKWLDSSGLTTRLAAHCFTHREPDSLEKLLDDMNAYACGGGYDHGESYVGGLADRLTALMERGA